MNELIDLRNGLIAELDAGFYDAEAWQVCAVWAEMIGCESIRAQVEGYIKHYGNQERWL